MKKTVTKKVTRAFSLILALLMTVGLIPIFATPVDATVPSCAGMLMKNAFPDEAFRNYVWTDVLHNKGTADENYRLSFEDSFHVATETAVDVKDLGIESLEGIEYFCALIDLDCSGNKLTELDLRLNGFLKKLDASENALAELDLSKNLILSSAKLDGQKVSVVLGTEIDLCEIAGRRDLSGIKVDGVAADKAYNAKTGILSLEKAPKEVTYSAPVNNKNNKLEVTLVQMTAEGFKLNEAFPDKAFAEYVWKKVLGKTAAVDYAYVITEADAEKIAECKIVEAPDSKIKSLEGIEFFINLEELYAHNNSIEKLELITNAKLEVLNLSGNKKLSEFDLSAVKKIKVLDVSGTAISALDLSKLADLKELNVSYTAMKSVNVASNAKLEKLSCSGLGLTSLDVSKNKELKSLDCSANALTYLNLKKNTKLSTLHCNNNALTGLDLDNCKVKDFKGGDQKKTIELSGNYIDLEDLAEGNSVTDVKVNGYDAGNLYNKKTGILSVNGSVWSISYKTTPASGCTMSVTLSVKDKLSGKEIGEMFPDDEFAEFVWTDVLGHTRSSFDEDNELTVREVYTISAKETLDVSDEGIKSLTGISYFTSLVTLNCSDNELTKLDLSENKYLVNLNCSENDLVSIDVTKNCKLKTLDASDNALSSINVTENEKLVSLDVSYNNLTSLDVTENDKLEELDCSHNKLTALDLTNNEELEELDCSHNSLVYVDLSETDIYSTSYVDCNDQTVTVEMTYTVDLEKLTGVDDDEITVTRVNGKTKGFEVVDGTVYSDSWIKTVDYKVEVRWSKSGYENMTVELVNAYATEGYSVTYKPGDDGEGDVKVAYKAKNKTLTLEDALFTRDGYVQTGWATKDGGEKVYDLGDEYTENESVTLYPVWSADVYTVKFNSNGGNLRTTVKKVSYGEKYGKLPTPTREGYDFVGWYTEKVGGDRITANTKVSIRKNHTLYARWTKSENVTKYTLEFITNGGEPLSIIETAKGSVIYLTEYTTKRDGYTFGGWYLDAELTEKVTKITLMSDTKVYAKWTADSVEGSMSNFKLNGVYGGYADVDESMWYGIDNQGVVRDVTLLGIMVGDGENFRPSAEITIAEIVKMAAVVHNTYYGGLYTFDQSEGTYWFDTYVEYAVNNNIIKAGEFADYTAAATRAEMAYIFANALPEKEFAPISSLRPSDVDLNDKYVDEIEMLYSAGVITGTNQNGDFVGDRTISRAEAAAIIVRVALTTKRIAK